MIVDGTPDLRTSDVATLLAVVRCRSVTGAARHLKVTPSQVSKAVARLETALSERLFVREASGVVPTETGRKLLPLFEALVSGLREVKSGSNGRPRVTVAATALLSTLFVPALAAKLAGRAVTSVELPPGLLPAFATSPLFDVALSTSEGAWPASWDVVRAGSLTRALYASPARARKFGQAPVSPEKLRGAVFIRPVYSQEGQLFPGDDGCPLGRDRKFGHETQTAALALELAAGCDEVVFVPSLLARPFVRQHRLQEIAVRGWDVSEPLLLACHATRVSAKLRRELLDVLDAVMLRASE